MPVKAFAAAVAPDTWLEVSVLKDSEYHVTWHVSRDTGTEWLKGRRMPVAYVPTLCLLLDMAARFVIEAEQAQ